MCVKSSSVLDKTYSALGYTIEYWRCEHCDMLTDTIYKFNGKVIKIDTSSLRGLTSLTPNDQMNILAYEVERLRDIIDVLKTHILGNGKDTQ
jgi:hypothetical protein